MFNPMSRVPTKLAWLSGGRVLVITLTITIVAAVSTIWLFHAIYDSQPSPYMDEVFHINQALSFCNGNYSYWDKKITTLPGLYVLSVSVIQPLRELLNLHPPCTVYLLRFINLVILMFIFNAMLGLQTSVVNQPSRRLYALLWFNSLTLSLFPVGYFFSFLYYTDPISTAYVLTMIKLHVKHDFYGAAFCGAFACFARQTNIIWVAFCTLDLLLHTIEVQNASAPWRLQLAYSSKKLENIGIMFQCIIANLKLGFPKQLIMDFLVNGTGYACVWVSFLLFVVWNNGIVVGDRSAHQAVLHIPQLFYFSLFTMCFGIPYFLPMVRPFLRAVYRNKWLSLDWSFSMAIVIYFFTMEHPYLLADNRHYVFYIWQRIYQRHFLVPYMLIPVYMFSGYSMIKLLAHNGIMFQAAYGLCLVLCLVPQKLLEFRYFIIPYILFRLNVKVAVWQLCLEFIIYLIINMITAYLFIYKPFQWPNSTDIQRFMW